MIKFISYATVEICVLVDIHSEDELLVFGCV